MRNENTKLLDMPLSVRAMHILCMLGIKDLRGLLHTSKEKLAKCRNMGTKTLNEIDDYVRSLGEGYHLGMTDDEIDCVEVVLKIKKTIDEAIIPTYAHDGDACMDLYAARIEANDRGQIIYHTGIAVEIPRGYVGLVFPRSSIRNHGMVMANSVGVIDSGYRGEISCTYYKASSNEALKVFDPMPGLGERCGQLMIIRNPLIRLEEVRELSQSERGEGGHGSSGR